MNLQESIRRILRENKKPSNFLLRRLNILDYEVEKNLYGQPLGGSNICIFFKSDIEYFETIMENSIDSMYYNYFSHIDDNSGEWAHEYLDMVNYIRKKYQYKIMKHYDDNCGSGSIPLKENIRRILREGLLNETRVPRSERVELYKDENIIVVVPLTHRALQKYAHQCQWCINSDNSEWEDYHKGKHAVIIQRNPKKPKIGITGQPVPSEIFVLAEWDNNESSFEDICGMLEYEFRNDRTMSDYYVNITNDINNFATNIVYYSPVTGMYDQENNFLWNFNYEINKIPNVTPQVIKIMDDYLQESEEMNLQETIKRILMEEFLNESDPKTGTGKKPKGSDRRLYTDENPSDTVSVKFKTKEDIVDTLNKDSFKSKPHKRQSQIINLIHQRVRAAYQNAKDPEVKQRLKKGYDYITNVKEKSKQKTIRLQKQKVNESDESKQERKFTKLLSNIEEYINSNSYDSVVRVMVDYDEVMDDVIVNIFFDAEKARELGGGINSVIKRTGKKIMEDLSVFPFDFKYHIHFEKPQLNESIMNENKDHTKLIKGIIDSSDIFDYKHFCGVDIITPEERSDQYNFLNKDRIPYLIKVYFVGGPNSEVWPRTQAIRNKELDLMEELHEYIKSFVPFNIEMMGAHVNSCDGYERLMKRKYTTDDLQESIRRILKEEDYSPAGKKVTPNNIVIHKSNPMFRDKIMEQGLKVRAGECYKIFVGYGVKCKPAIFATNSTNKRAWFDSTYDDDVWFIDTRMIPDVKWYKDRHFESTKKHIVTFQDIPKEAITLYYEGTGSGDVKIWDKDSPNIVRESIKKVLKEETEGIDSFLDEISSKHNMSDELRDFVKQFIEESDCKRINFSGFKMPVMGLALESGVLINKMALNRPLPFLLFLIFHEVAHQYQFKKYGEDIMYDCYLGEISEREAAEFMKQTEEVADEFAGRKIRQLQKLNLIGQYTPPQMYKNVPIQQITMMVNNYREDMRRKNIDSPKKVSEYFYNMVKSEL